jgi:hypothetical protein
MERSHKGAICTALASSAALRFLFQKVETGRKAHTLIPLQTDRQFRANQLRDSQVEPRRIAGIYRAEYAQVQSELKTTARRNKQLQRVTWLNFGIPFTAFNS